MSERLQLNSETPEQILERKYGAHIQYRTEEVPAIDDKYNPTTREVRVADFADSPRVVNTAIIPLIPSIDSVPTTLTISVPEGVDLGLIEQAVFKKD